jgi:hypothetical protein
MPNYRFYFLNQAGHLKHVVTSDCADDAAAVEKARELQRDDPTAAAVEVWDRTRCLFVTTTA